MANGYAGRMLFADLSTGSLSEEVLDNKMCREFIGGYGLAARVIYSRQKPGVDPLGPENFLGFVTGPLTGTAVPTAARYTVVGKSPLTGGWGDANSGGDFGPYLKFSGFDAVFVRGISPKPVYLLLDEGKAQIKDASALWGKDAYETEDLLNAEYGRQARVACIGQAGEKVSFISCVMTDHGSAAGRSGLGAVMGAKKLKAVVARGAPSLPVADKDLLERLRMDQIKGWQVPRPPWNQSVIERQHKYGTSTITYNSAQSGDTPVKNWGGVGIVDFPDKSMFHEDVVAKSVAKLSGCWHCPIACKGILKEGSADYRYASGSRRPEYETAASFGLCCGNTNVEAINMANDICNRAGLDTISAGTAIAFAIECFENGILTSSDTGGIDLRWGNHQGMIALTNKLARREGLGDILADGVKVAAEKIGKGAERFAVHVGGQEVGMHDPKLVSPRGGFNIASYQMDATPGRHTAGFGPSSFGKHITNSCGVCFTGFGFGGAPDTPQRLADYMRAATGMDVTPEEMLKAGERIANMRHAFNLREGINQLRWYVHPRIVGNPPLKMGPLAGVSIDAPSFIYWNLGALDWDRVTTKPSKAKLLTLGLNDVAADLWPDQQTAPVR
jgi:aldehyde:ferredoxin oxidoreductase